MNEKYNLAFFTLIIVGLFSLFSIDISAQNKVSTTAETSTKTCSGKKFEMPASIAVGNDAFGSFIKVASLAMKERKDAFSKLSNEDKATFIKINLALQLVKRPNMTKDQQEFVLDAISKVSADLFDKSDAGKVNRSELIGTEIVNKAFVLFSRMDAGDFIEPLNTDKGAEVSLSQNYEDLLKNGSKTRMTIIKEIPANERVNIWKTQLAYHLATGKFSKVQNEFILEMMASLSPELYTSRENLTEQERSKVEEALLSRILSVFTKDEGFAIFASLGIQKYVKDETVVTNNNSVTCNCNWSCSGASETCTGKNGCQSSEIGACGPFGTTRCHYLCVLE